MTGTSLNYQNPMEDVNTASPSPEAVGDDVQAQGQGQEGQGGQPDTAQAGSKTDSALLLKALHEERERRRIAELRAEQLEQNNVTVAQASPDTEDADPRLSRLEAELKEVKTELGKAKVMEDYPTLKEHWKDFDAFRSDPENKGMNLRTAAKAFLTEKGLLEARRPGLEKPTGGAKAAQTTGMSVEDVTELRQTNFKKYMEMVQKGLITIKD